MDLQQRVLYQEVVHVAWPGRASIVTLQISGAFTMSPEVFREKNDEFGLLGRFPLSDCWKKSNHHDPGFTVGKENQF